LKLSGLREPEVTEAVVKFFQAWRLAVVGLTRLCGGRSFGATAR
jgi:hypothetical protein